MSQANTSMNVPEDKPQDGRLSRWIKRFGAAGFLFFLIKGLLWLIIPTVIAWRTVG